MCTSGGSSGPTESTVTQTNLPEFAEPFYKDLLARVGYESAVPYDTYPGQRLEYFAPAEQEAMRRFEQLGVSGTPDELVAAGDIAARVAQEAGAYTPTMLEVTKRAQEQPAFVSGLQAKDVYSGYDPSAIDQTYSAGQGQLKFMPPGPHGFAPPVDYTAYLHGSDYRAGEFEAGQLDVPASSSFKARLFDPGYVARGLGQDYTARDLQSQYAGDLDVGPGFQAGTIADPRTIEQYMSPYQQLVVDREKEEARRQSEIMEQQIGLQAAGIGSLGGYREAIMQAERQRSLEDQLGDIQAAGSQQAFEQAQRAFEADRAARFQAGQFGLQTGQAQQQALQEAERFRQAAFGTTEQARQAQQQMAISSFEAGERARQQAAQIGLSAQEQEEASRRAQEQFRQSSEGQKLEAQTQQQQINLQAYQAREAARQRAAQLGLSAQQQDDAAKQAEQQFKMKAFESGIGARAQAEQLRLQQQQQNEQARQRQMDLNISAYQASQQARQQAARLGLDAAQIEQAGRIAVENARREAEAMNLAQARAAAQLGQSAYSQILGGGQQRLAAAGMLGDFVSQRQAQEMERLRAMQTAGQIQRELAQRGLDVGYTDFLRQQAFPKEQLAFYSSMLQGLPIAPGQVSQTYGVTPSTTQQLLGAGIAGVGLYNALGGFGG